MDEINSKTSLRSGTAHVDRTSSGTSPLEPHATFAAARAWLAKAVVGLAAIRARSRSGNGAVDSAGPDPVSAKAAGQIPPRGTASVVAGHGDRAQRYHDGAAKRIDAALYEIDQLRLELHSVIEPSLLARLDVGLPAAAARTAPRHDEAPAQPDRASTFTAGRAARARSAA